MLNFAVYVVSGSIAAHLLHFLLALEAAISENPAFLKQIIHPVVCLVMGALTGCSTVLLPVAAAVAMDRKDPLLLVSAVLTGWFVYRAYQDFAKAQDRACKICFGRQENTLA